MNIMILMGSPRLCGNTAELCKPFIEELKENGAKVRYVTLADKDIHPCKDTGYLDLPDNGFMQHYLSCLFIWYVGSLPDAATLK